jgi:hypothetical protein
LPRGRVLGLTRNSGFLRNTVQSPTILTQNTPLEKQQDAKWLLRTFVLMPAANETSGETVEGKPSEASLTDNSVLFGRAI